MIRNRSIAVLAAWLAVAVPSSALAQSQAANGNVEGIIRDTSGAVIPGVTVTVTNVNTGATRTVVTNNNGLYRALALPLGIVLGDRGAAGFPQVRAGWPDAHGGAVARPRHQPVGRWRGRERRRLGRDASRRHRKDRCRPEPQRAGDQEPAARVPESVQLRARSARCERIREPRVRRAALQRERHPAQGQLPDRRQYQYAKGPRRPAAAARLGSDGAGSEGRHEWLRARVRSDDGTGLQRDYAFRHEPSPGLRELSLQAQAVQRVSVSLHAGAHRLE